MKKQIAIKLTAIILGIVIFITLIGGWGAIWEAFYEAVATIIFIGVLLVVGITVMLITPKRWWN